jgi:PAS domain S-box-containing protein
MSGASPLYAAAVAIADIGDLNRLAPAAADILDCLDDAVAATDRDGRIVLANRAMCELSGWARETLVGQLLWECVPALCHSEAGEWLLQAVTAAEDAAAWSRSYEVAGREFELRLVRLPAGGSAAIFRDLSERRRGEAELRRLTEALGGLMAERDRELARLDESWQRERLFAELIIENASEGIVVLDTELRHLVWNAAIERINGMPRRAVLGRDLFEVFPQFRDHPVGHAWREALAGRPVEIREFRFASTARGGEVVYDADFTPLYDQRGRIVGALCMLREITERLHLEEALRHTQKMEAVAQLTGGVAHDFNNLLTAVVGCLELILHEEDRERVVSHARTAMRSADRGARLIKQLLAFSRRQVLQPVTADLNGLLAEIETLLQRAAGEGATVTLECAPGLACCAVDPAQFEAAAMNLVMNARDAMPQGGRVTLATANVEIGAAEPGFDLPPGQYVAFSVRDTGTGMTSEVLARAFEPFYTTKEIGKGSGLGLSMVYGFAKQSGGAVRLARALGEGTAVTLYLPRAPDPPAAHGRTGTASG